MGPKQGLSVGTPRYLFERWTFRGEYGVTPNGESFLLIDSAEEELPLNQLILVQN